MATEVSDGVVAGGETNGAAVEKKVTFTAVKPQVFVESAKVSDAVAFYKAAFGAEEVNRVSHPKRKADQELPVVISAEIKLASASFLVSTASEKVVGSGQAFCLETEDIEAAIDAAVKAGAVADGEVSDGEGTCVGKVKDPYGVLWAICTPAKKAADVEA